MKLLTGKGTKMSTFAQKLLEERKKRNMTQTDVGKLIGISQRMVLEYETAGRRPHQKRMELLAEKLDIPYEYLSDDRYDSLEQYLHRNDEPEVTEPEQAIEDVATDSPRAESEARARREAEFLKTRSLALFAGAELPQEAKDAFFESLYEAYLKCREQAVENGVDVDKYDY